MVENLVLGLILAVVAFLIQWRWGTEIGGFLFRRGTEIRVLGLKSEPVQGAIVVLTLSNPTPAAKVINGEEP